MRSSRLSRAWVAGGVERRLMLLRTCPFAVRGVGGRDRVEGWGWWAGGDRQFGRAAVGAGGSAKLPCLIAVRWEAPHGARARVGVALVAWPGLLPAAGLYIRSLC